MPFESPQSYPEGEKIIGSALEEEKELEWERFLVERKWELEHISSLEREKTDLEKLEIAFVSRKLDALLSKYGIEKGRSLSEDDVHIIDIEKWNKSTLRHLREEYGGMMKDLSILLHDQRYHEAVLLHNLFHEAIHFKSYQAFQSDELFEDVEYIFKDEIEQEKGTTTRERRVSPIMPYRVGLQTLRASRQKLEKTEHKGNRVPLYFRWLNEAITEELAIRMTNEIIDAPPSWFKELAERIQAGRKILMEKQKHIYGEDPSEILPAKPDVKSGSRIFIWTKELPYKNDRNLLWKMIDKIAESNMAEEDIEGGDKDAEREKIFDQFATAMFNGNLLPIGRQMEKTFGRGSLKRLGEEDFLLLDT